MQIGLELRQAWLVNGILFNSEVWHNVPDNDIAPFVEIDKYLLKGLLTAHAKTPVENIYTWKQQLSQSHISSHLGG